MLMMIMMIIIMMITMIIIMIMMIVVGKMMLIVGMGHIPNLPHHVVVAGMCLAIMVAIVMLIMIMLLLLMMMMGTMMCFQIYRTDQNYILFPLSRRIKLKWQCLQAASTGGHNKERKV